MHRVLARCLLVGSLMGGAMPLMAQETSRKTVVSANPFGLLADFFNAEVERAIKPTTTVGIGGSTFGSDGDRYLNADLFARYYPSGRAFDGWNLGVKAGITTISSDGISENETAFGYGFDINRSWLLGPTDQLSISVGFGLKRIVAGDSYLEYVPTFRIVNVGWRF